MKSFKKRWNQIASRVGTSPRQLGFMVASAVIAVVIFGSKMLIDPKSASATTMQPAAAIKVAEPTVAPIPDVFLRAAPHWNLATSPARNPFSSPEDLRPRTVVGNDGIASTDTEVHDNLVLQATLDHTFAVINGKTLRIGQSWTDPKTKRSMQLIEVGDRNARLSFGGHNGNDGHNLQVIDLTLDH